MSAAAFAGELFPYNPPAANAPRQMEQRPPPRAGALSTDELRRINELATEVRGLPPAQKNSVRAEVQDELDRAVSRHDLRQVRYYNELLRQIDRGR